MTNGLTKEVAKKFIEGSGITREEYEKNKAELEADLAYLYDQRDNPVAILCSHNTILGYKCDDKMMFVVDTSTKRNLRNIFDINKYLNVPRYEPKTAKAWLAEPLALTMPGSTPGDYEGYKKVAIGERELRDIVIQDKETSLNTVNHFLEIIRIAEEA